MNTHMKFLLLAAAALFACAGAVPVVSVTTTSESKALLSPHRANPTAPYVFNFVDRQANATTTTNNPVLDTAKDAIDTAQKYTGLSRGAIIGIAIGVAALVVILLFACCCCCCGICRK